MARSAEAGRSARMQPLWARVDANRTKLTVFVALFVLGSAALLALALVAVPGGLIGWALGWNGALDPAAHYWRSYALVVAAAMGVLLLTGSLIAAVQLSNAEDWVTNRFKGRTLQPGEAPGLEDVLSDIALAAGLAEPPRVLVLTESGDNAFAIGTARKRAVVGITEGMLEHFTVDELRAVVATLVARIVAGDIMFATALAALMGPIKAIRESRHGASDTASCALSGCASSPDPGCGGGGCVDLDSGDDAAGCLGGIAVVVFIAVVIALTYAAVVTAAWIVTLWGRALNRASYEKADAEGMLLLKDPAPMVSALRRAIRSSTLVADGDQSYDGIFYAQTSGTPKIERAETQRFERLCEVLGVEGMAARLGDETDPPGDA